METKVCLLVLLSLYAVVVLEARQTSLPNRIKFVTISTEFTRPIGIDYYPPTNSLITSAYYSDGRPYNFERLEFDGTHVRFSSMAGMTDEIKIAVTRPGNIGGFQPGDFFTGNGLDGQITKISDNGNSVNLTFCQLGNPKPNGLLRGGLKVDETGVWGGDLIAVTTETGQPTGGQIWRVNSRGEPTLLAYTGVHLEGLLTVPADTAKYGFLAGKIIAGYEGGRKLYVCDTQGTVTNYAINVAIEDIDFVYPNENFFGVNYGQGRILGARAADFAGLEGEIMITQESGFSGSGLWILRWDSTNNVPYTIPLLLAPGSETSDHWEHVTFAKAGVLEIPPPYPLCYRLKQQSGETQLKPLVIGGGLTIIGEYSYNQRNPYSSGFADGRPPYTQLANTLSMWFTMDYKNSLSLVIHVDSPSDSTGGSLQLQLKTTNIDGTKVNLVIQDDGTTATGPQDTADNYFWTNDGQGLFTWQWKETSADGVVLAPLPVFGLNKGFCFTPTILSSSGISSWNFVSQNPTTGNLDYVAVPMGESPTVCVYDCDKFCFLFSDCITCAHQSNCTWCQDTQECLQTTADDVCAVKNRDYCPCPYYNQTCDQCAQNPNCGWCCVQNGGSCVDGNVGGPVNGNCSNWRYSQCQVETCSPSCVRGSCVCGKCECPVGYGGPTCDQTYGCDGTLGSGAVIDVCGDCGGNGTRCLGCDGLPFGKKYDQCGICGGIGNSCFDVCGFSECSACAIAEGCTWCGQCVKESDAAKCGANTPTKDCSQADFELGTTALAAGISVVAIVLIVVGSVAAVVILGVGSKKGWDYYQSRQASVEGAQTSPLYHDNGRSGNNPFYKEKDVEMK